MIGKRKEEYLFGLVKPKNPNRTVLEYALFELGHGEIECPHCLRQWEMRDELDYHLEETTSKKIVKDLILMLLTML